MFQLGPLSPSWCVLKPLGLLMMMPMSPEASCLMMSTTDLWKYCCRSAKASPGLDIKMLPVSMTGELKAHSGEVLIVPLGSSASLRI